MTIRKYGGVGGGKEDTVVCNGEDVSCTIQVRYLEESRVDGCGNDKVRNYGNTGVGEIEVCPIAIKNERKVHECSIRTLGDAAIIAGGAIDVSSSKGDEGSKERDELHDLGWIVLVPLRQSFI